MMKSSVLMLFLLLVAACSVKTGHLRKFDVKEVEIHDLEKEDVGVSVKVRTLPGLCKVCKWSLDKVKKIIGPKATAEKIKAALLAVCNEASMLKSVCQKFVTGHLNELIKALIATNDVRSICVKLKACKPKEKTD